MNSTPLRILLFFSMLATSLQTLALEGVSIKSKEFCLVGKSAWYVEDPTHRLTHDDFWRLCQQGQAKSLDVDVISWPATPHAVWIVFAVDSSFDQDLWLNVDNNNLDTVDFFKLNEEGQVLQQWHTGNRMPMETRVYEDFCFWFPLRKREQSGKQFYLLRVTSSIMFEVPLLVGSFETLSKEKRRYYFYAYFFTGVLFIMVLYNLFIFGVTRDRLYLIYSLHVLTTLLSSTYLNSFPLAEYLFGKVISGQYLITWLWLPFFWIGWFTIEYLEIRKRRPIFFKIIVAELSLFVVFVVLNLFIPTVHLANSFQILTIVYFLSCVTTSYVMWREKGIDAKIYSIAWTSVVITILIYLMVVNGLLMYTSFTRNIVFIGVMIEIFIFSMALGHRINSLKENREKLIAELDLANRELTMSNQSLDSFNYHVSHDLKTILTNTASLSRMTLKYNDLKNSEKVKEIGHKLIHIAENGMETVQSFLTISALNGNKKNFPKENVKLVKGIYQIIEDHNLQDQLDVRIIQDHVGELLIHKKSLESLFLNLFTNSIKYCNKFPEVKIWFNKEGNNIIFAYQDNGIGIDLEVHGDQLFSPFYRVKNSKTVEGSGVGLFIINSIVRSYGGRININSKPGLGTYFELRFPASSFE